MATLYVNRTIRSGMFTKQMFSELNRIQCRPFTDIVRHHPKVQSARMRQILADTADVNRIGAGGMAHRGRVTAGHAFIRSEEHTSELKSLMRITYADFRLTKK